jgi:uncharacterized protein (UPF0261 family)
MKIGDRYVRAHAWRHRDYRLNAAGKIGHSPGRGSVQHQLHVQAVQFLSDEMKRRKYFNYNPNLVLVRLIPEEMIAVGREVLKNSMSPRARSRSSSP